jgi:hypothetical protein
MKIDSVAIKSLKCNAFAQLKDEIEAKKQLINPVMQTIIFNIYRSSL